MTETLQEPVTAEMPDVSGILAENEALADAHADAGLKMLRPPDDGTPDRPGWIPPDILCDWDTDPYAYQTEEELMPAGGLHGEWLTYLSEILRDFLENRGMRFLADTFMVYRDTEGIMQRIAPDLLIIPFQADPPSSYDLDEEPPPLAAVEIISPKSRLKDMKEKVSLYARLGIPAYLVVDPLTSRERVGLHLWRKGKGRMRKMRPDSKGHLRMPEMGVKVRTQGRRPVFADLVTGEMLLDTGQLRKRTEQEAARADQEATRADQEATRADQERERAERLAAKLRELGIALD